MNPFASTDTSDRLSVLQGEVKAPFDDYSLLEVMFELSEKINPHLASYDLVVGDDTSGRLPAIFLRHLVNQSRAQQGLSKAQLLLYKRQEQWHSRQSYSFA